MLLLSFPAAAASPPPDECRARLHNWIREVPNDITAQEFRAQLRSEPPAETAIIRIYEFFRPLLINLYETKHGLAREDAEDLASKTLLTVLEKRRDLADSPNPIGFILRTGKYKLLDFFRAAGNRPLVLSQLTTNDLHEASTASQASTLAQKLREAHCLGLVRVAFETNLSAPERTCFAISALYPDLGLEDQSALSGVSATSHSTIASNGRGKLRRFLAGDGDCIAALANKTAPLREYLESWVPAR